MDTNNENMSRATEQISTEKPKRKWTDNAFIYLLVSFGMTEIGGGFIGAFVIILLLGIYAAAADTSFLAILLGWADGSASLPPLLETITLYLPFIGIWGVCLLWFLWKRNRPLYKSFSTYCAGNNAAKLLLGFGIGAAMNGACILAAYLNGNIQLSYDSFPWLSLLATFVCVFIQSSAEELVCRGYLYQKLLHRYRKPAIAIFGNSLLFSLLHIANPGVSFLALVDIFVSGVLFSLMVYYMDSLWCAFAAHAAWNFTQNIIFGLPNSGQMVPLSIFKLNLATASDSFAYNVAFGVEGTVLAVVIEVAVCVLLWLWGRKHAKNATDIWADTALPENAAQENENTEGV